MGSKKIIIVGAGIIGLTSAYTLAKAGYDVTIIERGEKPGAQTSKANAGQLLFGQISAMARPQFLASLPKTLLSRDKSIKIGGLAHYKRWPWSSKFLAQCTTRSWHENSIKLLALAKISEHEMSSFRQQHSFNFNWRKAGKLTTYPNQSSLKVATRKAADLYQSGYEYEEFSRAQCLEIEPALDDTKSLIAGAIYLPRGEVGDCYKFCQGLAQVLSKNFGVEIIYNTRVREFVQHKELLCAVQTDDGPISADVFVLAAGNDIGNILAKKSKLQKPITGIKGISLTCSLGAKPPDLSVTNAGEKFVIARLGRQVRVTGYAYFCDNKSIDKNLVDQLITKANRLMPGAIDTDRKIDRWAGWRPTTPDDLPVTGRGDFPNLFINGGHGSLGWTLAFGSAQILQRQIDAMFDVT